MFMPTRVFRFVAFKLGNVPLKMPVCTSGLAKHDGWSQRSHVSSHRYTQKQEVNKEEFGLDDMDAQIEAVIKEEKRMRKTLKFHKIHRQLRPSGPPVRKLTWEAIEQIRFLKRESPEEWTIERLAEGFSVTPDEISRILHSTFNPSPERKLKQDAKLLAKQQQPSLADGTKVQPRLLPRSSTPLTLPSGTTGALVASQSKGMMKVDSKSSTDISLGTSQRSSTRSTDHLNSMVPTRRKDKTLTSVKSVETEEDDVDDEDYYEDEDEDVDYYEDEEVWDGVAFSDAELQDIAKTMAEKHIPVVQRGREYFDADGNFLYRV
ncbi:neugrin [Sardina pilchardus]|uniref:neugrin n=1 Tax=Sardina pilchardus TaxID=27697 RepID=UPI002E0E0C7D